MTGLPEPSAPRTSTLRRFLPWILLVLAGAVWFERYLPGQAGFAKLFGSDGVLRFAVGFLAVICLLQHLELLRLETAFRGVLGVFAQFRRARAGASGDSTQPGDGREDTQVKHEAATILVAALASTDMGVRQNSLIHLRRLTGVDHGYDQTAWRAWIDANLAK